MVKIATKRLAIPAPTSNLIAALVFEGVEPDDVFEAVALPGVTEALVVLVGLGRETLLNVIEAAPGIGTVTDALPP